MASTRRVKSELVLVQCFACEPGPNRTLKYSAALTILKEHHSGVFATRKSLTHDMMWGERGALKGTKKDLMGWRVRPAARLASKDILYIYIYIHQLCPRLQSNGDIICAQAGEPNRHGVNRIIKKLYKRVHDDNKK